MSTILESDGEGTVPQSAAWRSKQVDLLPDTAQLANVGDPSTQLFDIMERLAQRNPFKGIKDPVAWQREMREDVTLPWPSSD